MMLIGIDDTDSIKGMCTTYLAALLYEQLGARKYPRLIRLNPNIPYKTRGNGAVSLEVDGNSTKIKREVLDIVSEYSHTNDKKTNPGVVFLDEKDLNCARRITLAKFYEKTVSELVTIRDAEDAANLAGAEIHKFKNGRGIIGALAAVGAELSDTTYEFLAYRMPVNYGKEKKIDPRSVIEMNKKTSPQTFGNIDPETKDILIIPHGDDPVFCGIRGESPKAVEAAWNLLRPLEAIERTQVFETNQGTDAHLKERRISGLKAYDCAILKGTVSRCPETIEGGHVIFELSGGPGGQVNSGKSYMLDKSGNSYMLDISGNSYRFGKFDRSYEPGKFDRPYYADKFYKSDRSNQIACAAYQPTGGFRDVIRKLVVGDFVMVYGGIGKYPKTLNLEKIRILKLSKIYKKKPPVCCGRNMTSLGTKKGFRCKKCGKKTSEDMARTFEVKRELKEGIEGAYEVPPRARRHLSMPLARGTWA